ncbi:hypothetical protein HN51_007837 [Arachis hypogaea]|uniref:Peptidyl-prolyl cis-trans isomerase n=2 Tax=Arachis TaxID=3817 RepID=A0A445D605_ARAHY|nr:peptidyl-prolyl cis-trans isomerase CYP23 [Arachis duranensis]XP_025700103.1 peptidyl-prolyl cis-trans isomerase CYP23 [Arachis hypogaea]XP_057758664.1 peptidyl-prolyl cis-trans isomerase CYP23-like [Arachis stenosperma]XP_057758665.1 peptidyl-prolyl cis-trans isomerase CYP23-like [Arachis stenosperma]QHO42065.1 Peptidyl-prolyl cis-trans isomerase [Arachis hypogaea]RYR58656.1 hypothetical protein Ahy_A05g024539 isoform A [Arachis hypogaea]
MYSPGFSFMINACILLSLMSLISSLEPQLGSTRVVFQTNYGDIEFGFFPTVAPKTVDHIFKLVRLGGYNTNHFFRVDKGFVAQVADVMGGRSAPMNEEQRKEAEKTVVGEFSEVKHVRGILSMGRYDDPDSGSSSFSILLGNAPHLDGTYAIFGRVTKGDDTLKKLEQLPTRKEGIFVMPTERITILSSYYYDTETENCEQDRTILKRRLAASAVEVEKQRMKCFP